MYCTPSLSQRLGKAADTKIVIIYAYFVIFLFLSNTRGAVLFSEIDSYNAAVNSQFLCEATGYVPGKCSREMLEQYSHPSLNMAFYITSAMQPIVLLLYLFNCRTLKVKLKGMKAAKVVRSLSSTKFITGSSIHLWQHPYPTSGSYCQFN